MFKFFTLITVGLLFTPLAFALPLDPSQIENLTETKGAFDEQRQNFTITLPHNNYTVDTGGVRLSPPLGLTSWATFKDEGEYTTVEGEFVIFEPQVNFVIKTALDHGLKVKSLQHRRLYSNPPVLYLSFKGLGSPQKLAKGVRAVFDIMEKTTYSKPWNVPRLSAAFVKTSPNIRIIESVLKTQGQQEGDVVKVELDPLVTEPLEQKSQVAFNGSDKVAIMLGSLITDQERDQEILRSLLDHYMFITAIHPLPNQDGKPLLEIHFLGQGTAEGLAKHLQAIRKNKSPSQNNEL